MIRKNKNAFTLVELLAVIVILAIILVIAVPKVMDIITDAKKATLESTAKMIASQAEKQKVQNTVLGKEDAITCDSVAQISKVDYANCSITFSDSDEAKVTIKGSGKFNNLWICNGTKTNAVATEGGCGLTCNEEEAYVQNVNVTKPYVVDYDKCIDYLEPIILSDDWGGSEGELISTCKNRISEYFSFEVLVNGLINGEAFTEEELISNNIVTSDSVFEENNITLGTPSSCVNYTKDVVINEWGEDEEWLTSTCSNVDALQWVIGDLLYQKKFTPEELIENNVVGSDSVFTNIKPGSSCVSNLKDIWVNEVGGTEEELQTLCSGKDIGVVTMMDYLVTSGIVSEIELIENNIIEGTIEEEKVCVPAYADDAVTYINNLYNDTNVRNKFGLIKDNTTEQNIRYAGKYVQNYVEFGNTGELWRIIGTFKVETANGDTEELVKIIRDESFKSSEGTLWMSWDSSASNINGGGGINEWSQADLKNMLNTYYLGTTNTCTYCNGWKQSTCSNSCNNSITPINSTYTSMIESVVWKTGAIEWNNELSPLQAYNAERGSTTGKICTQGNSSCNDTVTRTTEWEGKIGLIYPSDFGYAGGSICTSITWGSCSQNNWVPNGAWNWTISPDAYSDYAHNVWSVGDRADAGGADLVSGGRAALYLKSNVQIKGGDGSKNNPYKLK